VKPRGIDMGALGGALIGLSIVGIFFFTDNAIVYIPLILVGLVVVVMGAVIGAMVWKALNLNLDE
jgi:hypothetical protein